MLSKIVLNFNSKNLFLLRTTIYTPFLLQCDHYFQMTYGNKLKRSGYGNLKMYREYIYQNMALFNKTGQLISNSNQALFQAY
jgi:hypothetical protein